jgi:hypothetical protein
MGVATKRIEGAPDVVDGLTLRQYVIVSEVRHWGCIRATARLGPDCPAETFEAVYVEEMDRIWELNEEHWSTLRHLRSSQDEREFWADLQAARAFSLRSDVALFKDMILRP